MKQRLGGTHARCARTDEVKVGTSTTERTIRCRLRGDDGTSLIELTVGLMVMSLFLAMFTGAVVAMNRAENKTESVSLTTSQLNQAYLTLDKTVRYAAAISPPGTGTSGDWYVELRTTNTGSEVCTQLRVNPDPNIPATWQLQRRTWSVPLPAGSAPTDWAPVTSYLANGGAGSGASPPFVLKAAVAYDTNAQQLTFNLATVSGAGPTQTTSLSVYTFTAANSTIPPPTGPICQDQGRP
jgi:type II secretory pathway pseudopilin PulG